MKLEATPGFFLAVTAAYILDGGLLLPAVALAACAHECGHLAALSLLGADCEKLRLTAAGAEMTATMSGLSYLREAGVYLAGPLFSGLFALLAAGLAHALELGWLYTAAGVSLALGAFNLLPVAALDGGCALRAVCMRAFGREHAALHILSFICAACIAAAAVYVSAKGGFCAPLFLIAGLELAGDCKKIRFSV